MLRHIIDNLASLQNKNNSTGWAVLRSRTSYNIKTNKAQARRSIAIMQYEQTEVKPSNMATVQKNMLVKAAKRLTTMQLLWIIVVRHKFGIMSIICALSLVGQVFPPFWDIVKSLI